MNEADPPRTNRALWGWSVFTVGWALLLLFAGANVTTTRSGDAIPSWPQPWLPRDFGAPALIEWSHRGVALWMGVFTLVLAVWTQLREPRRGVRRAAWAALGLVVAQAVLGGVRVLLVSKGVTEDPAWIKVLHAGVAEAYVCLLVALATVLSPAWRATRERPLDGAAMSVIRMSLFGTALLFVQAVLGAVARHGLLPREVHAFFALPALAVVARLVLVAGWDVPADAREIRRPASLLGVLAAVQLALGLVTYFIASDGVRPEEREAAQVVLMNLHLAVGAAMLGTTLSILMRAVRVFGLPTDERVAAAGGVS